LAAFGVGSLHALFAAGFMLIVLTAMKKWRLLNGVKILIALDGTGGLLYRYKLHPRLL